MRPAGVRLTAAVQTNHHNDNQWHNDFTPTFEAMITPMFSLWKALRILGCARSHFASSLSSSAAPSVSSPLFRLGCCTIPSLNLSLKCFNCCLEFLKFWFSTVRWLGVLFWSRYFTRRCFIWLGWFWDTKGDLPFDWFFTFFIISSSAETAMLSWWINSSSWTNGLLKNGRSLVLMLSS